MLKTKIVSAAATAALFASVFAPAAMAANANVAGNGAYSLNKVNFNTSKSSNVSQSSSTTATNVINSNANSGNNKSKYNVGGTSSVNSGVAASNVGVAVVGGSNNAAVIGCGCPADELNVNVLENGAFSWNEVNINKSHFSMISQSNSTSATNVVSSNANSGNNTSAFNVGGSSNIGTAPATSTVTTVTTGGDNNLVTTP